MTGRPLCVLCLEDAPLDAELAREVLVADGYDLEMDVVADRPSFEALLGGSYDVILADFALPGFDAMAALDLATIVCPTTPFICVSGTIGEEATVELLKQGADDCVLKDRLGRLPFAIRQAIEDRAARKALTESERRYRSLFDNLLNGFAYCRIEYDAEGRAVDFVHLDVNPAFTRLTGLDDVVGKRASEAIPGILDVSPELLETYARVADTGKPETLEFDFKSLGTWLFISAYSPEPGYFVSVFEDITERHEAVQALLLGAKRLQRTIEGAIEAMGAMVTARDPYTAGHQRRVTALAVAVAEDMGCESAAIEGLRLAGLVHDIGKLSVPAEILTKPARLNELEFALIKEHPRTAHDMLSPIDFEYPIADIALQHHERIDGSGYPAGLTGDETLLEARILAVTDVVEAMASHRPYRPALGVEAALDEVRDGAGTRYDADVVAACERVFAHGFAFPAD